MNDAPPLPAVGLLGDNPTRIWGLTPAERIGRIAAKAGLQMAGADHAGPAILIDSDYAFDPLWLGFLLERPGSVLTIDGHPAMAHVTADADAAASAMAAGQLPAGLAVIRAEDHKDFYNKALRKLEWPFLVRLTPDAVPGIERRSYFAAYKGVTDILTKYLWPEWALVLTRIAARIGMSPNMVTAIGAAFNILAMIAFWQGAYWTGMALGLVFMVLDTVDGKLARCTITSTGWGEVFDHGIDLVHPPFWWWAWGVGLSAVGLPLSPATFATVMAVIVVGYVVQRLIEGAFIKRFGMDMHVWHRIDSRFRLITARRNPNMVILFVATLLGRPDTGLILVAWWTALSCLFHLVRLLQAEAARRSGRPITSWMG
jgi:phosphatidylglycerophosphate synthase